MVVTRVAPSPSGYLHAGNAVNFLLTRWVAEASPDSRVHLRIDDIALPNPPVQYLDDIFWAVDWLGIPVTDGPADVADFRANFSQVDRLDRYREGRDRLLAHPATFVCRCSRRMVARRTADEPDPCRDLALPLQTGRTSLRFPSRSDDGMGDFVVWRRDGLPAYQLVSVVMDQSTGVDTVVRGADLAASTRAQLTVAEVIGATGVVAANYLHHPLVTDRLGSKLSKRDDAEALRAIRDTAGGKARLERLARAVGAAAGLL